MWGELEGCIIQEAAYAAEAGLERMKAVQEAELKVAAEHASTQDEGMQRRVAALESTVASGVTKLADETAAKEAAEAEAEAAINRCARAQEAGRVQEARLEELQRELESARSEAQDKTSEEELRMQLVAAKENYEARSSENVALRDRVAALEKSISAGVRLAISISAGERQPQSTSSSLRFRCMIRCCCRWGSRIVQ